MTRKQPESTLPDLDSLIRECGGEFVAAHAKKLAAEMKRQASMLPAGISRDVMLHIATETERRVLAEIGADPESTADAASAAPHNVIPFRKR